MELEIGAIYEGKVTGITKFGAFVQLPGGKSGMVHISEIANSYVDDISKFLKDGQQVQVKLIGIDQANRINLSIKKALPQEERPQQQDRPQRAPRPYRPAAGKPQAPAAPAVPLTPEEEFENKLKAFMQSSESRMSDVRSQKDRRSGARRRK
ncbi:MAG: S1 RNA-binding domain-containing protein [Clostridia bacterium]|nr:S1 RNA-binding domain-containing protein [Clostridia bacterium]